MRVPNIRSDLEILQNETRNKTKIKPKPILCVKSKLKIYILNLEINLYYISFLLAE